MFPWRMKSFADQAKINQQSTVAVSPRSPFGEGSPRHAEELQNDDQQRRPIREKLRCFCSRYENKEHIETPRIHSCFATREQQSLSIWKLRNNKKQKQNMSNSPQTPSLSAKLKTKNAANKLKHGSPKLQEVLRQRCRERMREKRGQLFDRRRQGLMETDEDVQQTLTEIVRSEFSRLDPMNDFDREELFPIDSNGELTEDEAFYLENEIIAEEQQWILMEYERLQQDEAEMFALFAEETMKDNVVCPFCEKDVIAESPDALSCLTCDFRMPRKASVQEFGKMIQDQLSLHSSNCYNQPGFMFLPENNTVNLYLTCENCSSFAHVL